VDVGFAEQLLDVAAAGRGGDTEPLADRRQQLQNGGQLLLGEQVDL
jgi:hypothetical protein